MLVEAIGKGEFFQESFPRSIDYAPHVARLVHVHERDVSFDAPGLLVFSRGELAVAIDVAPDKRPEAERLVRRPWQPGGAGGEHDAGDRRLVVIDEPQHVQPVAVLGRRDQEAVAVKLAEPIGERGSVEPRIVGVPCPIDRRGDPCPVARRRRSQIDPIAVES